MSTAASTCNQWIPASYLPSASPPAFSRRLNFSIRWRNRHFDLGVSTTGVHSLYDRRSVCRAIVGANTKSPSPFDDGPYEVLPNGQISYLDEQDVATFLNPPFELIPLDPSSFNPAAYLWKKIEEIPEQRRHRLISLLKPRLIERAWQIAGRRYDDPKLSKKSATKLLSNKNGSMALEFWNCRTSGGPVHIALMNFFNKALFFCKDGKSYGRFIGGSFLSGITENLYPLYFMVRECSKVMSTELPCDFACEFGDGLLDFEDRPNGFPKPAKHPWPLNDQVVIYVRPLGPGVLVGQAWQEGEALEQVPKKLCGEILMVKDFLPSNQKSLR